MSKFESPQRPVDHEQPPVIDIVPRKTVRHIPLAPHQYTERITPSKDVFVLGHVFARLCGAGRLGDVKILHRHDSAPNRPPMLIHNS